MKSYQNYLDSNVINIFEALDDGVYVSDKEGTTLHVNSMYEKITGLTSEELLGQNVRALKEEGIFDAILNPKIVKTGKPATSLQTLQDGRRVVLRGFPVFDDKDELVLIVTLVRNVTLIEQMREQISQQENQLFIRDNQLEYFLDKALKGINLYKTPQTEQLSERIQQAGAHDQFVLLRGESGMGKGRLARLVHENSPRKNEMYIKIDCGSLSKNLIESQLFGYVPEAPSAFERPEGKGKLGYIEIADKGTIFLNGIEELPLQIQEKLLRVLRDQEVTRVASTLLQKIDVRIIAASSSNLEDEIKNGNFSRDLYQRLSETIIDVQPLRESPEIIPELANHYLKKYSERYKKDIILPEETMNIFLKYQWPGNITELKHTLHCLAMTCEGHEIFPQNLPPAIQASA